MEDEARQRLRARRRLRAASLYVAARESGLHMGRGGVTIHLCLETGGVVTPTGADIENVRREISEISKCPGGHSHDLREEVDEMARRVAAGARPSIRDSATEAAARIYLRGVSEDDHLMTLPAAARAAGLDVGDGLGSHNHPVTQRVARRVRELSAAVEAAEAAEASEALTTMAAAAVEGSGAAEERLRPGGCFGAATTPAGRG